MYVYFITPTNCSVVIICYLNKKKDSTQSSEDIYFVILLDILYIYEHCSSISVPALSEISQPNI
jgi:hypothetical protein